MSTELNKGRAIELYESLEGTHTHDEWLRMLVKAVCFLLARYIDGK